MRTLLGLVPPKAVRNETTSKARSRAAQATGARKSIAVKAEKELAVAAAVKAEVEAEMHINNYPDGSLKREYFY